MAATESSRMRRMPSAPRASNTGMLWNAVGSQPVDQALAKMKADGWVEESSTTQNNCTTKIMKRNGVSATLYVTGGAVGMIRFQAPPVTATPAKPDSEALTKVLAAIAVLQYLMTHGSATRTVLQEKLAVFNRMQLTQGIRLAHAQNGFRSPTGRMGFSEIEDFMLVAVPGQTEVALKTFERRAQQLRGA